MTAQVRCPGQKGTWRADQAAVQQVTTGGRGREREDLGFIPQARGLKGLFCRTRTQSALWFPAEDLRQ